MEWATGVASLRKDVINNLENIYEDLELRPLHGCGWGSYHPIFEELILKHTPKTIIEVGSWHGMSAGHMCNICKKNNITMKMWCVDTWLGELPYWVEEGVDLEQKNGYPTAYYTFLSNMVHFELQDIVTPFPSTSTIAAKYFEHNNITADMIYIDGSHLYDDVKMDIKNYYPLVNQGGVLLGDDYNKQPVIQAVNEFVADNTLTLHTSEDPGNGIKWYVKL